MISTISLLSLTAGLSALSVSLPLAAAVALAACGAALVARSWGLGLRAAGASGLLFSVGPYLVSLLAGPPAIPMIVLPPIIFLITSELVVTQRIPSAVAGATLGLIAIWTPLHSSMDLVAVSISSGLAVIVVLLLAPDKSTGRWPYLIRCGLVGLPVATLALSYPIRVRLLGSGGAMASIQDNHGAVVQWLGQALNGLWEGFAQGSSTLYLLLAAGAVVVAMTVRRFA